MGNGKLDLALAVPLHPLLNRVTCHGQPVPVVVVSLCSQFDRTLLEAIQFVDLLFSAVWDVAARTSETVLQNRKRSTFVTGSLLLAPEVERVRGYPPQDRRPAELFATKCR